MGDRRSNCTNLLSKVVCFRGVNSKWPRIGIVKGIHTVRGVVYAKVECDSSDPRIWKWISKTVLCSSNVDKSILSIPAARLQILQDVTSQQNDGNVSKPSESTYTRLGFCVDVVLDEVGPIKKNHMVVWIAPASQAVGFSQPPVGEVKRIIQSASTTQVWVDFTDPVIHQSPPECVRFGCKPGHGMLVHVGELLSMEQYAAMTDAGRSNEDHAEYAFQEEPSAPEEDLIKFDNPEDLSKSETGHLRNVVDDEVMDTTAAPDDENIHEIDNLDRIGTPIDVERPALYNKQVFDSGTEQNNEIPQEISVVALPPLETIIVKLDEVEPIFGNLKHHLKFNKKDYLGIAFERPVKINFPHLKQVPVLPFEHGKGCGFMVLLNDILNLPQFSIHPNIPIPQNQLVLPTFPLAEQDIAPPIQFCEFQRNLSGDYKRLYGIEGKCNSCYVDSTLFSMFAFGENFDYALVPDRGLEGINEKARQVIKHLIVNQLRKDYYVEHECVGILRRVMMPVKLGITDSEMDVEEFLTLLLEDVLQIDPFLHYSHDAYEYIHSIALHNDEFYEYRTVQFLLEKSFKISNITLEKLPSPALILQMPVCNGKLVNGSFIIPNLTLDMSKVLTPQADDSPTKLDLTAVICLNSSHYTCFVKTGQGVLSNWVFFDSSPSTGIPRVVNLRNIPEILEGMEKKFSQNEDPLSDAIKRLPEFDLLTLLLKHSYILFYTLSISG